MNKQNKYFLRNKVFAPAAVLVLAHAGKKFIDWLGAKLENLFERLFKRPSDTTSDAGNDASSEQHNSPLEEGFEESTGSTNLERDTQLVGTLIRPGDTCLVFGQSDIGKSVVLRQFAASIASGIDSLNLIGFPITTAPQHVFYYDTEGREGSYQSLVQQLPQEMRGNIHYINLKKNKEFCSKGGTLDVLCEDIKIKISQQPGNCTVVIDNLSTFSKLKCGDDVIDLFNRRLHGLKEKKREQKSRLTILLATHVIKSASRSHKSLTEADLAGSAKLFQLADCVLGLELSRRKCRLGSGEKDNLRVLKRLKWKHGSKDSVFILCPSEAPYYHFLCESLASEEEALADDDVIVDNTSIKSQPYGEELASKGQKVSKRGGANALPEEQIEQIRRLEAEGVSPGKIALQMGITRPTVNKYRVNVKHRSKSVKCRA